MPEQGFVMDLMFGVRDRSIFEKTRGFLRKVSVQPRPPGDNHRYRMTGKAIPLSITSR